MNRAFADTSFYIAVSNRKDTWHAAAVAASEAYHSAVVTTDYVLLEIGNHLCDPGDRELFLRLVEMLREDENTTILSGSAELFEAGLRLYRERRDKRWSLTDCISFAVMEELGIQDALSCDHHFEQAGFRILVRR